MNPKFKIGDSKVLESREALDGTMIRRRRETPDGKRFTTYERIELPTLVVVKRDGKHETFDRDKLKNSVKKSVGKFLNADLEIEDVVDKAMDILYGYEESTVTSEQIGEAVLEVLGRMNEVAYIRFASVFRKFKTLEEFEEIINKQRGK